MALVVQDLADKIRDEIASEFGTVADDSVQNMKFCRAMARAIIDYFKANADINLSTGDISIAPGTFEDSLNVPITGLGENSAVILNGKIE
jgi:hypothetical protein